MQTHKENHTTTSLPYFLKLVNIAEHTVFKTKSNKFDMYWQVQIKLYQTAYIYGKSIAGLDLASHFDI